MISSLNEFQNTQAVPIAWLLAGNDTMHIHIVRHHNFYLNITPCFYFYNYYLVKL